MILKCNPSKKRDFFRIKKVAIRQKPFINSLETLIRHKQTDDKALKKLEQKCQKKNYTEEQNNWYISQKRNQTKYECSPNVDTVQTRLTYYCWSLGSNKFSNMMIISETRVSNSIVPCGGNSFNLIFNFLAHFRALIFPSIYKFLLSPRPYFM